jgi:hypothetical protein
MISAASRLKCAKRLQMPLVAQQRKFAGISWEY